jgi:hypothetical protein
MHEVEFDDGEICEIPVGAIRQRYSWDTLEVGDQVKARYHGGYQEFEAIVTEVAIMGGEPSYTIQYDDGEEEVGVRKEFCLKIYPVRCSASQNWVRFMSLGNACSCFLTLWFGL